MSSATQPSPDPESQQALDACFTRLYDKIRHLAGRLGWTRANATLTATALAHETYLKLRRNPPALTDKSQGEIIGIFAHAMRQILIDASRRRNAKRRLQDFLPETTSFPIEDVLSVAIAIEQLNEEEPVQGRIAEARFLLGMTTVETAAALGISSRTVEREWQEARRRLSGKMQSNNR